MKKLIGLLVVFVLVASTAYALITPDEIKVDTLSLASTTATNSAVLGESYVVFDSSGTSLETTLTIEAGKSM
jgi:hypothetical protein